jgi:ATP-dependent protease HslVU (ClpYQ) peptidase subunit
VPSANHRSAKILRVGSTYVAQTGWGLYENLLIDYLAKHRAPLRSQREIFTFFVRFWRELRQKYTLVNDQPHSEDKSPFADLDASFLVVNRSGIYCVASDMSVTEFKQYYAIGSGSSYALGALQALFDSNLAAAELARRACAAATTFDVYCGGELDLFVI